MAMLCQEECLEDGTLWQVYGMFDSVGKLKKTTLRKDRLSLISRVENWRAGLGRCLFSLLACPFVCKCPSISTIPRFQLPPRRTQHAVFPHYALPLAFIPRLMRLIVPAVLSSRCCTLPGSLKTIPGSCISIDYSTCPSRSLCVFELASNDAEPSFQPSPSHNRNTGWNDFLCSFEHLLYLIEVEKMLSNGAEDSPGCPYHPYLGSRRSN